jgi:hypothetical protein
VGRTEVEGKVLKSTMKWKGKDEKVVLKRRYGKGVELKIKFGEYY